MTAKKLGYETRYVSEREESMTNSLIYDLVNQMYIYKEEESSPKDTIFEAERKIIKELAGKGNCVIVGRCTDYILKDEPKLISLFLHAPLEKRIERIIIKEGITEEQARREIQRRDRHRADNYHYYTRRLWGMSNNYMMSLDTSLGEKLLDIAVKNVINELCL